MTLRTATYDDSTHKLVPLEPTDAMAVAAIKVSLRNPAINGVPQWTAMIAAAPEYQDKIADLESQDFYEVMQAYRHEQLHVARRFEFVKQWLRNPVYEYQDTKKDE